MITEDPNKKYTAHMTNLRVTYGYDDVAKVLFVGFQPKAPEHKHLLLDGVHFNGDDNCVVALALQAGSGEAEAILMFFSQDTFEKYRDAHPEFEMKIVDKDFETV
jgi:hypothetical protein